MSVLKHLFARRFTPFDLIGVSLVVDIARTFKSFWLFALFSVLWVGASVVLERKYGEQTKKGK